MKAFIAAFERSIYEFAELAKDLAHRPTPKKVHDLRVLSRKLRAALWIAKNGAATKVQKKLRREARLVGKVLGKMRELDVLIKDATAYGFKSTDLQTRRTKPSQQVQNLLIKEFLNSFQQDLLALVRKLKTRSLQERKALLNQIKRPTKKWPSQLPKNKAAKHQIRIDTKKIIYRLELLGVMHPRLKRLQKELGKAHDLEVLTKEVGSSKALKQDLQTVLTKAQKSFQAAFATLTDS